jgi:ssDNA-binding Zn-finger/Zn-ribbon topoisomerase 1
MKIFCGIELDDSSHNMATRQQRDEFVDKVFENAKLKLIHIPLKRSYSVEDLNSILENFNNSEIKTVTSTNEEISEIETTGSKVCPKCGAKMTLRTSTKGESAGKKFYGCSNYPHCREIVNI